MKEDELEGVPSFDEVFRDEDEEDEVVLLIFKIYKLAGRASGGSMEI